MRLESNTFPRLLTSYSVMVGMVTPARVKQNLSTTCPFLSTKDLDFLGLKLILAHVMSFSRPWRIHLVPGTEDVMMVRLSIKALVGGCLEPDFVFGPWHSTSADLATIFTARAKMVVEMVQPVIIPFSSRCQLDDSARAETLSLKFW